MAHQISPATAGWEIEPSGIKRVVPHASQMKLVLKALIHYRVSPGFPKGRSSLVLERFLSGT